MRQRMAAIHLQKFSGHVHAHKIFCSFVFLELAEQTLAGGSCAVWVLELPVWQQLGLVWLHGQHSLLSLSCLIELWMLSEVYCFEIYIIIELGHIGP